MFARHHAELAHRAEDGADVRAHLELSAARGNEDARRRLEGPEFPEALEYLWGWAMELYGRSGVGMAGLVPLTYTTVQHWSELTEQYPTPDEVQGLMRIDAALRSPASVRNEAKDPEPKPAKAWPEKKPVPNG
jgi:hypothetical protein